MSEVLADGVNRTQPKPQAAFLEAVRNSGWRICGELTPTCQKVIDSDQHTRSASPQNALVIRRNPTWLNVQSQSPLPSEVEQLECTCYTNSARRRLAS